MTDVKQHAARTGSQHGFAHSAISVTGRIRERTKTMGQDIALAQTVHHVGVCWGRLVDMHHQGQARCIRHIKGDFQRLDARRTAGVASDPHLYANDAFWICLGHSHRLARCH